MHISTKKRRLLAGVSLGEPLNYNSKWLPRVPEIKQMIKDGFKMPYMAARYGCCVSTFGNAMAYHGIRIHDIRATHKQEGV